MAGHVLVRNEYCGVNFIDIYQRTGFYPIRLPFIPGRESAGIVEAVGEGVMDLEVGDRVALFAAETYAEFTLAPRKSLAKIPTRISTKDAAATFLQGMTAAYLVTDCYPAAAGGTGLLIGQFCKALGATVIGTVSTEEKAQVARSHGVDHVIVYTRPDTDIPRQVHQITNGHGVQVVYDGVGKATFETSLASLARRGHFISFGSASGPINSLDIAKLTKNCIKLMRPALAEYTKTQQELENLAKFVFEMLGKGAAKPTIHTIYPLEDAAVAQDDLQSGKTIGKLLLEL